MNFEIDENGFVMLPGSDEWRSAYDDAERLGGKFPGQDAYNFVYAIHYNSEGPLVPGLKITGLKMLKEGCRDEGNWVWRVNLSNKETWYMTAACDYTGWDCQSWNNWTQIDPTPERHCETCSCNERY